MFFNKYKQRIEKLETLLESTIKVMTATAMAANLVPRDIATIVLRSKETDDLKKYRLNVTELIKAGETPPKVQKPVVVEVGSAKYNKTLSAKVKPITSKK